ncbi:hypothetical protein JCM11251_003139 [Rhodosporidiobolus azoricus]
MSFSDMTRSFTSIPPSSTYVPTRSSSSSLTPSSYTPTPVIPSTTASLGPSGVPGYVIAGVESAAGEAAKLSGSGGASQSSGGGANQGLALGLGLGLGIAALLSILAALFVVRQRRAQRADFDKRAQAIRATMANVEGDKRPASSA